MEEENTNAPAPGTTVAPTVGDTLNGSNGPVESAHQHETAGAPVDRPDNYASASPSIAKASQRDKSPVELAHSNLLDSQNSLHDKLTLLAHRLENVLTQPFKGSESNAVADGYGSSPVANKLAHSTAVAAGSHDVVDHLLNNLEV